ncbi:WecB/TagA/CpsF family glycosyltransferase [Aquitalea sp. S1-19]|nr:WecB/TagA/CpsF family glycosyltransferase [Aquitalea sp. S1-19]
MQSRSELFRGWVGHSVAAILWLALLPLTKLGLCRQAWQCCRALRSGQLHWIGPRSGSVIGLVSSARLHQRLGMLSDEPALDRIDASRRGWCFDAALLLRFAWATLLGGDRSVRTDERWPLLGLWLDNIDHEDTLRNLSHWWKDGIQRHIAFVNPHCANIACRDQSYRSCLNRADLLLPDGSGVLLAGRLLGTQLNVNTNGTDLFPMLCRFWQSKGASLYLLGGQEGVAAGVATRLLAEYPGIKIAGCRNGYFDPNDCSDVIAGIRKTQPDVLLVAMGAPLQDAWIAEYSASLEVPLSIGVGGLFDFYSGRIQRAPLWLRELGLEWCWRLAMEPGRLWRRYLLGNTVFLLRVLWQRLVQRPAPSPHPLSAITHEPADAVLCASQSLWQGNESVLASLLLPLAGMSLIERTILALVHQGVRHIHVLVDLGAEPLQGLLGKGERWGIRLTWSSCMGGKIQPQRLASLLLQEQVWFIVPGALPSKTLSGESGHWDLADGSWSGWAKVSAAQLSDAIDGKLPLPGVKQPFTGYSMRNPAELLQAQSYCLIGAKDLPPTFREVAARVWVGPGVVLESGVTLEGPVLIGAGSLIRRGCHVGPNVVLGVHCVLEQGVKCTNTLLQDASYVARDLDVSQVCAVSGQTHDVEAGCILPIPAADCLLTQIETRSVRVAWGERLIARIFLFVRRLRPHIDRSENEKRFHQYLQEVKAGQRHLIGLPVPSSFLNQGRLEGLRLGAIRFSALQGPRSIPVDVSRAEQDLMDDLYGAAMPCPIDWRLFLKVLKLMSRTGFHGSHFV